MIISLKHSCLISQQQVANLSVKTTPVIYDDLKHILLEITIKRGTPDNHINSLASEMEPSEFWLVCVSYYTHQPLH